MTTQNDNQPAITAAADNIQYAPGPIVDPNGASKPVFTLDQIIYNLLGKDHGGSWQATGGMKYPKVTYGINTGAPTNFQTGSEATQIPMTPKQIAAAKLAFTIWGGYSNLNLVESGGPAANITFNYNNSDAGGYSIGKSDSNGNPVANQLWINNYFANQDDGMVPGAYGFYSFLHEIGHALGIHHPGSYNGNGTFASDAEFAQDNRRNTIMSYFGGYDTNLNQWSTDGGLQAQTPMVYDIAAIQALYGANLGTRADNTVYGYHSNITGAEAAIYNFERNQTPLLTIWDGAGIDTLDASLWQGNQIVDLNPGAYSSLKGMNENVAIAYNAVIENAVGGDGNDTISGNNADNHLKGGDGHDSLYGGKGKDTLIGGQGNDTYVVDDTVDVITENTGEGIDTVQSKISYTLGNNLENLILTGSGDLTGTGNALDNFIFGGSGNNKLTGNAGNDLLDGGTGKDSMIGGTGDDLYWVDNTGDKITENKNEGTDTVQSTISYTLGKNVENLNLLGYANLSGTGNSGNNWIIGNTGTNKLTGNGGNDTLNGGYGADTLIGGTGNDTYYIEDIGDSIIEKSGEGTDTVRSEISYTLASTLENLYLDGSQHINGTGNTLSNILSGNEGDNLLTGDAGNDTLFGGTVGESGYSGNDTLVGGTGNDTYQFFGGSGRDTIVENDSTSGNRDVLVTDANADQLWFSRAGNHLEISILGTDDKMRINNWYLGDKYHVERFVSADNQTLLDTQIANLVNAMSGFAAPASGQTTLPSQYQEALAPVLAANWA